MKNNETRRVARESCEKYANLHLRLALGGLKYTPNLNKKVAEARIKHVGLETFGKLKEDEFGWV